MCEEVDGRCVSLVFLFNGSIVPTQSSCYVQPVGNLVFKATAKHVTAAVVFANHAVCNPIGVLHFQRVAIIPVLYIHIAVGVEYLVCANGVEAFAAGEQVNGR